MTSETTLSAAGYGQPAEDVFFEEPPTVRLRDTRLQRTPALTPLPRRAQPVDLSPDTDYVDSHGPLPADTAIESARSARASGSDRAKLRDSQSFAAWSRRYVVTQMVLDGLVGILAVAFVLQLPNA